jgi:hypothetical protein
MLRRDGMERGNKKVMRLPRDLPLLPLSEAGVGKWSIGDAVRVTDKEEKDGGKMMGCLVLLVTMCLYGVGLGC